MCVMGYRKLMLGVVGRLQMLYGIGQGSFGVVSGTDRSSVRWDHVLGFLIHSELKGLMRWKHKNI